MSEDKKKTEIVGNVTEGKYKDQQIKINFGDSPATTRVVVGGVILNGISKLTIVMDCNESVNLIKIEKWILPEG